MTTPDHPATDAADPSAKPVTLKDLARHLDLSIATVSVVLNRAPKAKSIPEETKQRVLAAARQLGYRPNFLARSFRSQRSRSVGVLVSELHDPYATAVLTGIERHLLAADYFYLMVGHRSDAELREKYFRLLADRSVEGFVLINTPLDAAPSLPVVSVSGHQRLAGVTNVVIDHEIAASMALQHLRELGHRRIAFFRGQPGTSDAAARWRAIVAAAEAVDLPLHPELACELAGGPGSTTNPERGYREGYALGQTLLDRGVDFTALFAFDDVSAIGAMRAFRDAGLRVPEDVSVIGFDDIQNAEFHIPRLTTVRQPLIEMGETAGRLLLQRLAGEDSVPDTVVLEPRLMVRESTGEARQG